jgi:hypothetical protein
MSGFLLVRDIICEKLWRCDTHHKRVQLQLALWDGHFDVWIVPEVLNLSVDDAANVYSLTRLHRLWALPCFLTSRPAASVDERKQIASCGTSMKNGGAERRTFERVPSWLGLRMNQGTALSGHFSLSRDSESSWFWFTGHTKAFSVSGERTRWTYVKQQPTTRTWCPGREKGQGVAKLADVVRAPLDGHTVCHVIMMFVRSGVGHLEASLNLNGQRGTSCQELTTRTISLNQLWFY